MKGVLNKKGITILLSLKSPNKEPLYGYLRTSISSRVSIKSSVFRQNRRVSGIILRGNITSKVSAINDDGNEKISNTNTLKV